VLFNSFNFLLFFPIVTTLYFLLPHKFRWLFLLLASCYFYMFFIPVYILILFLTVLVDYFAAIYIERTEGKRRKFYLVISILSTLTILFVFKYYNFFIGNFNFIATQFHSTIRANTLSIILPIGLSFHTFQSLSYVIEVYRKAQKAERHFGIYMLYVMFYPQLVAGPIERPQNLLHQFYEKHRFESDRVIAGIKMMLWGLFKKVVIADNLSALVDQVYNHPYKYNGLSLAIATVFFAIQIYCDFSGYSEMAIGAAKVMGFNLMQNFNKPYFSTSIKEFWTRWHISLSTWFKDYVYIPLGGNRVPGFRYAFNILITFLISGFWHGASWTYVIWGGLHGTYLVTGYFSNNLYARAGLPVLKVSSPFLNRGMASGKTAFVFFLVCVTWVFFRGNSVRDCVYIFRSILIETPRQVLNWLHLFKEWATGKCHLDQLADYGHFTIPFEKSSLIIAAVSITFLFLMEGVSGKLDVTDFLSSKRRIISWPLYYFLILGILFLGVFENRSFIYFQF